MPKLAWQNQRA